MRPRANVFRAFARQNRTAREVVRVLERNQARRRHVVSGVLVNCAGNFVPGENTAAVLAANWPGERA